MVPIETGNTPVLFSAGALNAPAPSLNATPLNVRIADLNPPSIARHQGEPGSGSFENLRALGIGYAQDLAHVSWTDYNLHDPGVTILEQACYALTDLLYRTEFPVADFLADEQGTIDWMRQGLLPPEHALPSRPLTEIDYRVAIANALPDVENVLIEPILADRSPIRGLYRVRLRMKDENAEAAQRALVIQRVREIFSRSRNLCEDLDEIGFFSSEEYVLQADVDIKQGPYEPADILARIYQECEAELIAGLRLRSLDRAKACGEQPERIFRGPFVDSGEVIGDGGLPLTEMPRARVFSLIRRVDGVDDVRLPPGSGGKEAARDRNEDEQKPVLRLSWPRKDSDIGVRLFSNGRQVKVSLHDLNMRLQDLELSRRGVTFSKEAVQSVFPRPQGTARPLAQYRSIQYNFPTVYGVGPRGAHESDDKVKARTRQLRGYLMLFDQPMADYLATLANLRHLYSTDAGGSTPEGNDHPSYFFQKPDEIAIPGATDIYTPYSTQQMKRIVDALPSPPRIKRLLDYLLALYGESMRDDPFKYTPPKKGEDPHLARRAAASDETCIQARIDYLREIEQLTRDRGAASDYCRRPDHGLNRSGLESRLNHLLGFERDYQEGRGGVRVMEHILLRPRRGNRDSTRGLAWYSFRISVLIPEWIRTGNAGDGHVSDLRSFDVQTVNSSCPAHICPDVYWLTPHRMTRFEAWHREWWNAYLDSAPARSSPKPDSDEHKLLDMADRRARKLELFLRRLATNPAPPDPVQPRPVATGIGAFEIGNTLVIE